MTPVMNAAQLINQTSGRVEYFTPPEVVEAAWEAMGGIDLDPASSYAANERIRAGSFFTEKENGLEQSWFGRVWLNHPFGRVTNGPWVKKLLGEYYTGRVSAACAITFACTSERWFQPLLAYPQCFLSPRTNYYLPDGSILRGVTKGSVVTYLGTDQVRFADAFHGLGIIKVKL